MSDATNKYEIIYHASVYDEAFGPVLCWTFPVCEPPAAGCVDDLQPSGPFTHFSRMPIVWDGHGMPKEIQRAAEELEKP